MKHTHLLLLAMALVLSLTACGGSQTATPAEPETPPSVAAIDDAVAAIQEEAEQMAQTLESITPKNPSKILPKESGEDPEIFPSSYALEADSPTEAYSRVLWYVFQYGLLPGETSWPTYTYSERAPGDSFAVYDIDNDGREELLFCWPQDIMASIKTYVWEYQNDVLYEELVAFPEGLIFYDNGVVHEDWSHNQGWAGKNFWPYALHTYDPKTDTYISIGSVDAWDINRLTDVFPTDKDQDGDGMLYFLLITDEDWNMRYGKGASPVEAAVDGPVYEAWRDSILQDGQPVEVPWLSLTRENISTLGYPEPEMPDWMSYIPG